MFEKENSTIFYSFLLIVFLVGQWAVAQTVSGVIYDKSTKQPIKGVNILITDSTNGTFTDSKGQFTIEKENITKLIITHVGYKTINFTVTENKNNIKIYLKSLSNLLNDVEIGITKNKLSNLSQSASISSISGKEIQSNISRSLAESMSTVPGVWMQKTNHGGGSPFVRGLTGNYVLILVDGIRMNNSTFRYGPNQYFNTISPFSVASIEVLRGAGSTLYGSDAIGGTININTINPSLDNDKNIYGSVAAQMMSNDMEYSGILELGGSFKNFAFITKGSIRDFGDSFAGEGIGRQSPSGYDEKDFMFKSSWQFEKNSRLIASYQWLRQDKVPRYDKVAQKNYEYYNFTLQQRQLAYLKYEKKWINSAIEKFQISYSFQQSNEERDTKKNDDFINKNERDDVATHGLTSQIDATIFKQIAMTSGVDFYYDFINSSRTLENTDTGESVAFSRGLYPDGSSAITTGIYNAYLYESDPWIFQLGWRYNYSMNKANDAIFGNLNQSNSSLVWNASVNYKVDKNRVYISANSAFRAPNINDISSLGDFDFGVEVPATNLKAETSNNFEIGYKYDGQILHFNATGFYTKIDNLIDRVPATFNGDPIFDGSDIYRKENVGKAVVKGVEMDLQTKISDEYSLQSSLTYTYGKNISKDEPFRRIPPLFGDVSLKYDNKKHFVIVQALAAGKQDRLSSGDIDDHRIPDGGTPSWFVMNIKTGVVLKNMNINLALNNIFNEAYRVHGSGIDGLGRHIAASVKYRF